MEFEQGWISRQCERVERDAETWPSWMKHDLESRYRHMPAKQKPITFSAPMVKAIIAGAKTQERIVVDPQPDRVIGIDPYWFEGGFRLYKSAANQLRCAYSPGDTLWVRESFFAYTQTTYSHTGVSRSNNVRYKADGGILLNGNKWLPPSRMPRWASRVSLYITGVRVQRIQDISEEDAWAECPSDCMGPLDIDGRLLYRDLWDSTNSRRVHTWESNPWVWVITFEPIDTTSLNGIVTA